MGRKATGSPLVLGGRLCTRVSGKDDAGNTVRPYVDLDGSPDLMNTPEGQLIVRRLSQEAADQAKTMVFVGKQEAVTPTVTVADLGPKFLERLTRLEHMRKGTRKTYETSWVRIVAGLGDQKLGVLFSRDGIPTLREFFRTVGSEHTKYKKPRSRRRVRMIVTTLREFFAIAKADAWAPLPDNSVNPMTHPDVVSEVKAATTTRAADGWKGHRKKDTTYFEDSVYEKLLASDLTDMAFGLLLIGAKGQRPGELHGHSFDDVKRGQTPYLQVRQQVLPGEATPDPVLKTADSERDLPLNPDELAWLDWWWSEGWAAWVGHDPKPTDLIFPNHEGNPWRPNSSELLQRWLKKAKLETEFVTRKGDRKRFVWTTLRHSFATRLRRAGAEADVKDALLGHAPESTRERHYEGEAWQEMCAAVNALTLRLPHRNGTTAAPALSAASAATTPVLSAATIAQAGDESGDEGGGGAAAIVRKSSARDHVTGAAPSNMETNPRVTAADPQSALGPTGRVALATPSGRKGGESGLKQPRTTSRDSNPTCLIETHGPLPRMKRSSSVRAHVSDPRDPRRPAGEMRPSRRALRSPPVVLKPQYLAARRVVMKSGHELVASGAGGTGCSERCSSAAASCSSAVAQARIATMSVASMDVK